MTEIEVTCSHCGAVYDRGEHGILLHPVPECEAALFARALQ
jgi:predicted  nucleic acid-binding Zn-ribbon protein